MLLHLNHQTLHLVLLLLIYEDERAIRIEVLTECPEPVSIHQIFGSVLVMLILLSSNEGVLVASEGVIEETPSHFG